MPRKGRGLELLVQKLERLLSNQPVEIKSPDYILGRHSNSRREVDIALRAHVGTVPMLVILECRDRDGTQDVTWIEQLASKCEDVGADKAIAVSATPFTAGAISFAKAKRIELRTFEEIDAATVFGWITDDTVEFMAYQFGIKHVAFDCQVRASDNFKAGEVVTLPPFTGKPNEPLFTRNSDGERLSLYDIFTLELAQRLADFLPEDESRSVVVVIHFQPPRYSVETEFGTAEIKKLAITTTMERRRQPIAVARSYDYKGDAGTLSRNAEVVVDHYGLPVVLGFHQLEDGTLAGLSARPDGSIPDDRVFRLEVTVTQKDGAEEPKSD